MPTSNGSRSDDVKIAVIEEKVFNLEERVEYLDTRTLEYIQERDKFWEKQVGDVIRGTTHETLSAMGFDTSNPQENQKDMAYLRRGRLRSEGTFDKAIYAVVGAGVAAAALWIKNLFGK